MQNKPNFSGAKRNLILCYKKICGSFNLPTPRKKQTQFTFGSMDNLLPMLFLCVRCRKNAKQTQFAGCPNELNCLPNMELPKFEALSKPEKQTQFKPNFKIRHPVFSPKTHLGNLLFTILPPMLHYCTTDQKGREFMPAY
jgi:hypothetical protein